jgi:hypothetical protein
MIIAFVVLATQKPPVVSGEIVQVWTHPNHVVTSGIDANGESMAKQSFDQVLVFARVKLINQSKNPLVLQDVLANIRQADGILSVSAGSAGQYDEVFLAYPELAALHSNPLSPRATIEPGQSMEGTAFWIFRMSRQEWEARKDLNFTFRFQYQANLVLAPPHRSYGTVGGTGALLGVDRYPVIWFFELTEFTTTSKSCGVFPL